jgi:hypothetical protein
MREAEFFGDDMALARAEEVGACISVGSAGKEE